MIRRAFPPASTVPIAVLSLLAFACGGSGTPAGSQGGAPAATPAATTPAPGASAPAGQGLAIDFASTPDPLRQGDNAIEVTVRQPDGSPVTDATVTAVFSMPAMPAMNMPAMKSAATLAHAGDGKYRGTGELSMGGTWTVALTVTRGTEQLGSRRFSVVAK